MYAVMDTVVAVPPIRLAMRAGKRSKWLGQGLTEFAIVMPLLIVLLLGIFDAGLLMFGVGTSDFAVGEGARIAAEAGNAADADAQIIQAIQGTALHQPFVQVTEIDIYKLNEDPITGKLTADANGCASNPCLNKYDGNGNPLTIPEPWASSSRNVSNGSSDFIGVIIKYQYNWKSGVLLAAAPLQLNSTSTVRLEPQTY
jgi:Flp pilus assembly protein TadG